MLLFRILIIASAFLICCSCSKKKKSDPAVVSNCDSTGTISYSKQIVPIINASCGAGSGACHNSTSSFGDFNTYQGFTSHPASHIIHCVKQDDPSHYTPMPQAAPKLSACNIAKIVNWVNQGSVNN